VLLRYLMVVLSLLMISNVPYPTFPRTGFRSLRAFGATILVVGAMVLLATRRLEYFFPIALIYIAWGLARWVFAGLFERRQPTLPYDLSEGEDDEDEEEFDLSESRVHASRQAQRDEAAHLERSRVRGRPERTDIEGAAPRSERSPRKPDRTERPAAVERGPEADRARREKKKDRPKRPERAERAERAERPERPERPDRPERAPRHETAPASPIAATAVAAPSGVDAITSGPREVESTAPADDEEVLTSEELGELETTAGPVVSSADGAPGRKRKRRRRRGERKERGPVTGDAAGGAVPATDIDRSPYASTPTAYSPPIPEAFTAEPTSQPTSQPAAPSPSPASPPPLPPVHPSSSEPSE
jgi:hypothetical protein